ncbi:hypothetical protein [Pseudomonas leptonychotis]|uniref:hypothetical protein n=1 Tax=Pseudomonas leptonychotis TaxID=2448482 RepID=UPI0039F0479A
MGGSIKTKNIPELEDPSMISEQHFSTSFTSVWHKVTPLADTYWRRENLKIKRELSPIENRAPIRLRGFLNELAFETFKKAKATNQVPRKETIITIAQDSITSIAEYIFRITKKEDSITSHLDENCQNEVFELTKNLLQFFPQSHSIKFRPKFSGCGIVSACEGDLIYQGTLYEIKAGDRGFRVSDIKQLLTYSSLEFLNNTHGFSKVGLFNPRTGYHWERTIDQLCIELSGMRESDTLQNITSHMTQLAISR